MSEPEHVRNPQLRRVLEKQQERRAAAFRKIAQMDPARQAARHFRRAMAEGQRLYEQGKPPTRDALCNWVLATWKPAQENLRRFHLWREISPYKLSGAGEVIQTLFCEQYLYTRSPAAMADAIVDDLIQTLQPTDDASHYFEVFDKLQEWLDRCFRNMTREASDYIADFDREHGLASAEPDEPIVAELKENERDCLIAMLELEALDEKARATGEAISARALGGPETANVAMSSLRQRGLVATKSGRGGGSWLTPVGLRTGRALEDPENRVSSC